MSKLFSNFQLNNLQLKNRIVMAPMCQYSADTEGYSSPWHFIHYTSRAIGGVGLILLEATAVESKGRISDRDLGIWKDDHVKGLKEIVHSCQDYGARVGIQLAHAGRKCTVTNEKIVAPSSIPFSEEYATPKELTREEIKNIVLAFQEGARRALLAGFDTVEIHGAHGYLINEFLSPLTNKRTDEYGGNQQNRCRFLIEIIKAIREVWPKEMPILLRASAEDYREEGNHPENLAEIINMVKDYGVEIIDVSSGGVVPASINPFPGYQVSFSEVIRNKTKIPTIAGGLITSAQMAEEILQNNRADLIFLGRELLRNPYWPLYAAKELKEDMSWPQQYERSKI